MPISPTTQALLALWLHYLDFTVGRQFQSYFLHFNPRHLFHSWISLCRPNLLKEPFWGLFLQNILELDRL